MPTKKREIPPNPPRWKPQDDYSNFQVPGVDSNAPVDGQVEKIDQIIVFHLQHIDENMERLNTLLMTKMLPAFKRLSINTQPIREASNFWLSFFEKAANERLPTYYDDTLQEPSASETSADPSIPADGEANVTSSVDMEGQAEGDSIISSSEEGSSFMPASGAISSTPHRDGSSSRTTEAPSWSLESPMVRLSREVQDLIQDDNSSSYADTTGATPRAPAANHPPASAQDKGKGRATTTPDLRRTILRQALQSGTPRANPFSQRGNTPSATSDLLDLSLPRHLSPERPPAAAAQIKLAPAPRTFADMGYEPRLGRTPKKEAATRATRNLLHPARPTSDSSSSVMTPPSISRYLGRGGSGSAAGAGGTSRSTVSSPPSISRYAHDSTRGGGDEDSPMPEPPDISRYVALASKPVPFDISAQHASHSTISNPPDISKYEQPQIDPNEAEDDTIRTAISDVPDIRRYPHVRASLASQTQRTPEPYGVASGQDQSLNSMMRAVELDFRLPDAETGSGVLRYVQDDSQASPAPSDDSWADDDSGMVLPLAVGAAPDADDSFGSARSDDSFDETHGAPAFQPMPVDDDDSFDDSFENDPGQGEEETLFGQRLDAGHSHELNTADLRLHGDGLLDETIPGRPLMRNEVEPETPTPWPGRH